MIMLGGRLADSSRSVRHHVTDRLRQAIVTGQIAPGERLGQDQLGELLGVSAAPVREALRQLESEGLVAYYPNRGCFVMPLDEDELLGVVCPVRLVLEQHAARHYVRTHPAPLAELREVLAQMAADAGAGDLAAVVEGDALFHETLVLGAGQPHTLQLWRGIQPRMRAQFYRMGPTHRDPGDIVDEHTALLAALESGDDARMSAELRDHIVDRTQELLRLAAAPGGATG